LGLRQSLQEPLPKPFQTRGSIGKLIEQRDRNHVVDYRITNKFQSLVIAFCSTSMRQRLTEQVGVFKAIPNALL